MGTNCSSHPAPVAKNRCGVKNEIYSPDNFCSPDLVDKPEFCESMSNEGEWEYFTNHGYCYSNHTTDYGFGCCKAVCGSPFGSKLKCKRTKFTGDKKYVVFKTMMYVVLLH